jgi:multiple sugar transport system ATP-binding protein
VAIGRAIVRDPKIFLFDEPLSNLDADLRVQMRVEIAKLHADLRATMIYVTHDQIEAMTMADKIVVLNDGTIEQVGAPLDVYNTPKNQFVAGFIGSPRMNFLKATVSAIHPSRVDVSVAGSPALTIAAMPERVARGSTLTLGVRPEHLSSGGGANDVSLTVSLAEQLGDKTLLYGSLPDGQSLVAQVPGQRAIRAGELVPIGVDPRFCHLFHADGNALSRITRS